MSEADDSTASYVHSRAVVSHHHCHHHEVTDVVISSATPPLVVDSGEHSGPAPGAPRPSLRGRTMGAVYPIMKNTIYSDEECEGEVVLNPLDCGGRFVLYMSGLFRHLTQNSKLAGLFLTTALILLFFKYSQQMVVKSVNSALSQHLGLEPSDSLRSSVIYFTEELESAAVMTRTLAWAFQREPVVLYDLQGVSNSPLLSLIASAQESFEMNMRTFIIHELPASSSYLSSGGRRWGLVGCQGGDTHTAKTVCMVTDAHGTATGFNRINTTQVVVTVANAFVGSMIEPLIASGKLSARATRGVWSPATQLDDALFNRTMRVISYLFPISFDAVDGHCTAAAGIGVNVEALAAALRISKIPNIEVIVADSDYQSRAGGQFVLDTFNTSLFWASDYPVTDTPEERVNEIAKAIYEHNDDTLMMNGSFYEGGLIYQSLTMMNRWALIASSPLVLSASEIEAAFAALINEYTHVTALTANIFVDCEASANAQSNNTFIQSVSDVERAFGARVHALYVAYELQLKPAGGGDAEGSHYEDGSSRGAGWGACGCTFVSATNVEHVCFYTDSNQKETVFSHSVRVDGDVLRTLDFTTTRRSRVVSDEILPTATKMGHWTRPSLSYDDVTGTTQIVMSYVLPFRFDPITGGVTAATVLDVAMDWLPSFLRANTHYGTTGLLLIDRREEGTFMGSRFFHPDNVYPAMHTPNDTVNAITRRVFTRAGSFDKSISFTYDDTFVNYQIMEPYWGVIEVIPASVALQRFSPTPVVSGATDALRLIPTGQTIELFLYVGGILAAYFLNLLILGCSSSTEADTASATTAMAHTCVEEPHEGSVNAAKDDVGVGAEATRER